MSEENGNWVIEPGEKTYTVERRAMVRISCDLPGSCEPAPMPMASQPETQWPARIGNISASGIYMSLKRRFEPGTRLIVELPTIHEATIQTLTAMVVRVNKSSGKWHHGCKFDTPLTNDELNALVDPS
jgi:hypothetical protein